MSLAAQAQNATPLVALTPGTMHDEPGEYGAIAFTPDGSFTSTWKRASKTEAEQRVRGTCTDFARGKCEVVSFGAQLCAAIASGQLSEQHMVTYAGAGLNRADAEKTALKRCNGDRRAGSCRLRTTVCGDGRPPAEADN
jgi:hypothetical protein